MPPASAPMLVYPMRILPETEVISFLHEFVVANNLKAAFVVSCVGSVNNVKLRFATNLSGKEDSCMMEENLEICSLVGTISLDGCHLHGTFGNAHGGTISGHIMGSMTVQTTVEIVIGNAEGVAFRRVHDCATGFKELIVQKSCDTVSTNKVEVTNNEGQPDEKN